MTKPTVMVALRDTESVESLVGLACEMATGMSADLMALHVVEIGPGLPLDADGIVDEPGTRILARAQQAARDYAIPFQTTLVRARQAGPTIVGEAEGHQAALLIMGYHGSHGLGEILLGSTVKYVARHTPCRLIVQVSPASQQKVTEAIRDQAVGVP